MRKALSLIMVVMLLLLCTATAFATEVTSEAATVYVTVSDEAGELALTQAAITVMDFDNDGALTIHDALFAAHEAGYDGGAAAGYSAEEGDYGLSITKLWGTENGGSYGYYVNNASAWSLLDPVKEGDYLNAFVYTDLMAWSDTYCYFDMNTVSGEEGSVVELTLSAAGYDAEFNPVVLPVEGAAILVNGVATEIKTDAEGKADVKLETAGKTVISASSDTQLLVPPVCVATVSTSATAQVFVSIVDEEGCLALAQESISVSDTDGDGYLTIHDALYAAHEAGYDGGAAAGYSAEEGDYGLGITKLWGTENGGSYGYYVNNASAWSLLDPVKDGDYLNAFVYTDLMAWSDTFCYFDVNTSSIEEGASIVLTLSAAGYDAQYNPVTLPVEGAVITVDGVATDAVTDADGKATVTLEQVGEVVISATSESQTLVPPVCKVAVAAKEPQAVPTETAAPNANVEGSADNTLLVVAMIAFVVIAAGVVLVIIKRKK